MRNCWFSNRLIAMKKKILASLLVISNVSSVPTGGSRIIGTMMAI